jgi:hypothetical protein
MLNRFFAALAAFMLCLPHPGLAQFGGGNIHTIGPDRGGALGVSVDTVTYQCGELTCVKITGLDRTNFSALKVGDYILKVNEISFQSVSDFFGLIRENSPGSLVKIDYWDSANDFAGMYQTDYLRSRGTTQNASLESLNQDLERVLRADAKHWRASTYYPDSLSNLRITSQSSDGRSYVVRGDYRYDGFASTNNSDWIDFHFYGTTLSCVEFGDERGCRPLLTEDRSVLGPVLVAVGVAAVALAASSGGSSPAPDYSDRESPSQCRQRCGQMYDPNMSVLSAMIAQCERRC